MTIKEKKLTKNQTDILIALASFLVLAIVAVLLSYLTLHFGVEISNAKTGMVTFVYGSASVIVGSITAVGYYGLAALFGITIGMLNTRGELPRPEGRSFYGGGTRHLNN